MFFEVDTKDIINYNSQLVFVDLSTWEYRNEDWAHLVIQRMLLRKYMEDKEVNNKKSLRYNVV